MSVLEHFLRAVRFTAKLKRYRDFSIHGPCPCICTAFPIIRIPHHRGTCVTTDEPTLTNQNHPNPYFTSQFCLGLVHSKCFDKHIMTHSIIIRSYRIYLLASKSSVFCLLFPPYSPTPGNHR